MPSQPAVIFLETWRPSKWFQSGQDVHIKALHYYDIPAVSLRNAVWHEWDMANRGEDVGSDVGEVCALRAVDHDVAVPVRDGRS